MKKSLAVYTVSHFTVDFACGFLLNELARGAGYSGQTILDVFLLYNCLAFGLQFLFGLLFDGRDHSLCALIGCLLLLIGFLPGSGLVTAAILAGLGNALFHVGGGIDSLIYSGGGMYRSGVFVSSGALGIALGTLAGTAGRLHRGAVIAAVLLCAVLIALWGRPQRAYRPPVGHTYSVGKHSVLVSALAVTGVCLLSVFIRSWVGTAAKMPWKTGFWLILAAAAASFAGKALGGFAADRFGARTVGTLSLLLSLPLLSFFRDSLVLSLVGLVLFNMTMPITLCTIASRLRGHEGFAFGLTTLGLLFGFVIGSYLTVPRNLLSPILAAGIAISALCVYTAVPEVLRSPVQEEVTR